MGWGSPSRGGCGSTAGDRFTVMLGGLRSSGANRSAVLTARGISARRASHLRTSSSGPVGRTASIRL